MRRGYRLEYRQVSERGYNIADEKCLRFHAPQRELRDGRRSELPDGREVS